MTPERQEPQLPDRPPETAESLVVSLYTLYQGVAPYSEGHKALLHFMQFEKSKNRLVKAQKRLEKSRRTEKSEGTVFNRIIRKEEDAYIRAEASAEAVKMIITDARLTNPEYRNYSRKTQQISEKLGKIYKRQKELDPLARVSIELTEVNDKILKRRRK